MPRLFRAAPRGGLRAGAGAVVLVLLLAGCSQGASSTLEQSLKDAKSATFTAAKAMSLFAAGRSTTALTSSALQDMLSQLNAAQSQVDGADTSSKADREARQRVRRALDAAVGDLTQAEDAVAQTPGAPSARAAAEALQRATARFTALSSSGGTA